MPRTPDISPEIDAAPESVAARRTRLVDAYAQKLEAAIKKLNPADAEWADVVAGLKLLGQFQATERGDAPTSTPEEPTGDRDPLDGLVLKLAPSKAARRRRRAG